MMREHGRMGWSCHLSWGCGWGYGSGKEIQSTVDVGCHNESVV